MSDENQPNSEATATARLETLVNAWNHASFEAYSANFTQRLVDHFNPSYFARIRQESGQWMDSQYLGCLNQHGHFVHLWRTRFEKTASDVLFSLTLTLDGKIAGLLKRAGGV